MFRRFGLTVLSAGFALSLALVPARAQTSPQQQAEAAIGVYALYFIVTQVCGFPVDQKVATVVGSNIQVLLPIANSTQEKTQQMIAGLVGQLSADKKRTCNGDDPDPKEFEAALGAFDKAARGAAAGLNVALQPLPEQAAAELVFASGSDVEKILAIAKANGEATLSKDSDGDPQIKIKSGNTNWSIRFYGCDKGENCKTIQFYYGISVKDKIAPATVNEWNRTKRWSKAYLDKDNDPNITYDVNLRYGTSTAGLNAMMANWVKLIGDFRTAMLK